MELDTGTGVSLMSESQFRKTLIEKCKKLESSNMKLKSYTGEPLHTPDMCHVKVEY